MRESERNVGRADHNPEGAKAAAAGEEPVGTGAIDSADRHGHGAHGRGRDDERTDTNPRVEPGGSKGADRGGSGGSSEASGGSVIDTRPDR
jgi:hypothetical protein